MVNRVRVLLDGFRGAPGVATFYGTDVAQLRTALTNFWGAVGAVMPTNFTATIATQGDILDSATGIINGTWSGAAITPAGGAGGLAYAGPVGATVTWLTTTVADGGRVRGRTFLVPLGSSAYDTDGSITDPALLAIRDAATAMVAAAAPSFVIWHRPLSAAEAAKRVHPTAAHGGLDCIVTGNTVPDRAQVLRSRRD